MELTFETLSKGRAFVVAAKIDGKLFPSAEARNMKDARREASDVALRTLLGRNMNEGIEEGSLAITDPSASVLSKVSTHFDLIAALSLHKFLQIAASISEKFAGRKVVACMIMKNSPEDSGRVVAVGTGNRCVTGERLSMEGKVVNDSHAEIVARRSLMRFFYGQLNSYYDGNDSIFWHSANKDRSWRGYYSIDSSDGIQTWDGLYEVNGYAPCRVVTRFVAGTFWDFKAHFLVTSSSRFT
ncbi:unnamed protein product [Pocillopora meandrina]|uniref:Uncharacterized protein n=1 Tax=Pocillopora meandrina TaxID=46732 RepID=A0AAU9Y258_9CNID|nr:unnamed protein product [Pocillopora meandrina]